MKRWLGFLLWIAACTGQDPEPSHPVDRGNDGKDGKDGRNGADADAGYELTTLVDSGSGVGADAGELGDAAPQAGADGGGEAGVDAGKDYIYEPLGYTCPQCPESCCAGSLKQCIAPDYPHTCYVVP